MDGKVGFIGLGLMGKPMARNLMKAGYSLVVHNIPPEPTRELAGEAAVTNGREVAQQSDIIITRGRK